VEPQESLPYSLKPTIKTYHEPVKSILVSTPLCLFPYYSHIYALVSELVSFLEVLRLKFYVHFSFPQCIFHVPPISSPDNVIWREFFCRNSKFLFKLTINCVLHRTFFSLHHRVQNGSGAHPACYPMGTRGCFPGGEAAGA
jgi:hypothetical protein